MQYNAIIDGCVIHRGNIFAAYAVNREYRWIRRYNICKKNAVDKNSSQPSVRLKMAVDRVDSADSAVD